MVQYHCSAIQELVNHIIYNIRKLRPYKGPDEATKQQAINQWQQERQHRRFAQQQEQGLLLPNTIGPIQNIQTV